ncbi:MAG TPA: hypothetical protein PK559_10955 [Ignavibacteriaceae bacterium]|nr:hypothetical protein [Ignavibacteriaceae bacterium]
MKEYLAIKVMVIFLLGIFFSGCYTQIATNQPSKRTYSYDYQDTNSYGDEQYSDIENDEYQEQETTTINNYYIGASYYSPYRRYFWHHSPSIYVGWNSFYYYDNFCWDLFWSWNWCYTPYIAYGFYVPFYSYYDYNPYWWSGGYHYNNYASNKVRTRTIANLRNNEGTRRGTSSTYSNRDVINSSLQRDRNVRSSSDDRILSRDNRVSRSGDRNGTSLNNRDSRSRVSERDIEVRRETERSNPNRERRETYENRSRNIGEPKSNNATPSRRTDAEEPRVTPRSSNNTQQRENVREDGKQKTYESPRRETTNKPAVRQNTPKREERSYSTPSRNSGNSSSHGSSSRSSGNSSNSGNRGSSSSDSGRRTR